MIALCLLFQYKCNSNL